MKIGSLRSDRTRQTLAVVLFAALALAPVAGLFASLWAARSDAEVALEAARAETGRFQATVAQLRAELASVDAGPVQVSLWPVDDPAATRARMQSTVARLAEDHGVTLRRAQTLDDADVDALKAAALRIEFEAPYDRFLRFVSAVHDHDPPLLLRQGVARRSPTRYEGVDQPIVFAQFQLLAPLAETPAEGVDE